MPIHHPDHHLHHHRHHHHHHPRHSRFLDALTLLVHAGKIQTVEELIRYCEMLRERMAAEYLRGLEAEGMSVALALEMLSAHIHRTAHNAERDRMRRWRDLRITMIFPLPPHVHEPLLDEFPDVAVLVVHGHHVPPHLRDEGISWHTDYRDSRKIITERDVIVFEGVQDNGAILVDPALADLLDGIVLAAPKEIAVHIRPGRRHCDVPLIVPNMNPMLL